jgi:hypothetical protein
MVLAGLALVALALFVPWWSRASEEGETTPLTWLAPATNINLLLFPAILTAIVLLAAGVVRPSRAVWRRALWAIPLICAGLAGLIGLVEMGYLEVFDDARAGMPLGFVGLAALSLGCLVSILRGPSGEPSRAL